MATAHNRKTRSDRLLWHVLNCFKFKLRLQYREAEIDTVKDPRDTIKSRSKTDKIEFSDTL